jgi:hypothetical protein
MPLLDLDAFDPRALPRGLLDAALARRHQVVVLGRRSGQRDGGCGDGQGRAQAMGKVEKMIARAGDVPQHAAAPMDYATANALACATDAAAGRDVSGKSRMLAASRHLRATPCVPRLLLQELVR